MTSTIYIDANRTNCSVKSEESKNEWTYKLASPLQIPAGSEIALQDSFIHKKGINGASIELEEDIEEEINFFYYLSDNPHFLPGSVFGSGQITATPQGYNPTFYPAGPLYTMTKDRNDPNAGDGIDPSKGDKPTIGDLATEPNTQVYGRPIPAQRHEFYSYQNTGFSVLPNFRGGAANATNTTFRGVRVMNDPMLMGYSEMPMMAVEVGNDNDGYNGEAPHYNDDTFDIDGGDTYMNTSTDANTCSDNIYNIGQGNMVSDTGSFVNDSQNYQIPNGPFGGKLTKPYEYPAGFRALSGPNRDHILRPKTGRVKIFIPRGVYSVNEIAQMIDDYFNGRLVAEEVKKRNDFGVDLNNLVLQQNKNVGQLETDNVLTADSLGSGVYTKVQPLRRYGTLETDKPEYNSTTYPIGDVRNDPYGYSPLREKGIPANDPAGNPMSAVGDARINQSKFMIPKNNQVVYVPVHRFNDMLKMAKYGINSPLYGTPATKNPTNSKLKDIDNRCEAATIYRWGYQLESSAKGHYRHGIPNGNPNNGFDYGNNAYGARIGLHCKCDVSSYPAFSDNKPVVDTHNGNCSYEGVGIYPDNYSYNPMRNGYYLGTPDFSFSYDGTQSAFTINGLHQSKRIPSTDMFGNPMTDSGNQVAYMKRPSDIYVSVAAKQLEYRQNSPYEVGGDGSVDFTDGLSKAQLNTAKSRRLIMGAANPEERIGGIAVHNWALLTARKFGDVDFDAINPANNKPLYGHARFRGQNPNGYESGVETEEKPGQPNLYKQYYSFEDFFTTKEKAREAWENCIWSKLGFSYDSLQNADNFENVNYYDMDRTGQYNISAGFQAGPKIHFADNSVGKVIDETYFKMPGISTKALLDISAIPQISTTYNTKSFNATLQQRYSQDSHSMDASGRIAGSRRGVSKNVSTTGKIGDTLFRTYDNHDVNLPLYPYSQNYNIRDFPGYQSLRLITLMNASSADYGDTTLMYINTMYRGATRGVIETSGNPIVAQGLPSLSKHGYYIITSDIVDGTIDDVKQGQPLPLLGIVPISNLSNQDFITTKNTITHTTNQSKVINKIKIKVLNPDLTSPILEDNSSVILSITMPLPQQTPMSGNLDDKDDDDKQQKNPQQPNPYEK